MFSFGLILKSILKSLLFVYPNLKYYRHRVSILLTVKLLSVYNVRNKNQSLDVVLPFSIVVFKIFL